MRLDYFYSWWCAHSWAHEGYCESSSSIFKSRLYFATRSERHGAPVLIWPALTATERSAIKASSVSPERWEMTVRYPAFLAVSIASMLSVSVPIWFTFMRIAFPAWSRMPFFKRFVFVTNKSSPTSWTRSPSASVRSFHPSQSSSWSASSIEQIGYSSARRLK